MDTFSLSDSDRATLLQLARQQIEKHFGIVPDQAIELSSTLSANCGLFVSLHREQELRGCLGCFMSQKPLYELVQEMALSAALNDYRFQPLTKTELPEISIEISVLTPLKKIDDISEIEMGKHGIYITDDLHSGTFLPQVATSTGWTKEEFLGHCSRDKAGLGWFGWKSAKIFTYEAIVFSENF